MTPQELTARAFEIADESMVAQLQCHAISLDEFRMSWAIVDAHENGVKKLNKADEALQEAVEWLTERGLVEVVESPDGLVAVLKQGAA